MAKIVGIKFKNIEEVAEVLILMRFIKYTLIMLKL